MTWPTSMFFKIHDMTQYILCVEIYIINIGQCHNIFNVLYVVKSALNTVCVLYIYWNITQRDAGNQLYSFSMWVTMYFMILLLLIVPSLFFFPFFLLPSFLLAGCLLLSFLAYFLFLLSLTFLTFFCFLAFFLAFISASLEPSRCSLINKKTFHFSFSCGPEPSGSKSCTDMIILTLSLKNRESTAFPKAPAVSSLSAQL